METLTERKYLTANTLLEAYTWARENAGSVAYVAGGTDFWVNTFHGNKEIPVLIDLSNLSDLRTVEEKDEMLRIGSQMRLHELSRHPLITTRYPALVNAMNTIATPVIRKTATIGGNLLCENRCIFYNQSEFWRTSVGFCLKCQGDICIATGGKKACFSKLVSDTAPVLLSWDAQLEYYCDDRMCVMPLKELYSSEGVSPILLPQHAIITAVLIPARRRFLTDFNKLRKRESMDFTSLSTAVTLHEDRHVSIVLVGIDPGPVCVEGPWEEREQLTKKAIKKTRIVDNDVFDRKYRKAMIGVFLHRSFATIEALAN